MAFLRRRDMLEDVGNHPTTEPPISELLNYRQYAGDIAMLANFDEPDVVDAELDDFREALAGTARTLKKESASADAELVGLKNALVCLHDVFKAYAEHNFDVPELLVTMREKLEQRRNELDPHSPHPP